MTAAAEGAAGERNQAIDMLRGVVMVLMALDHARDFFSGGFRVSPTDLATTTPILFATRWITHFCAPVFVFLAGTAAFLYGSRRTPGELSYFLLTRGLWLVFLELTVMRIGWTPDPFYRISMLQVIWAIGWSMVLMSLACRLPLAAVAVLGLTILLGHNLFDSVHRDSFGDLGWLWSLAHERGTLEPLPGRRFFVAYPILPWFGVMAVGFVFGKCMQLPRDERRKLMLRLGLSLTAAFVVLRAVNLYGDPQPWSIQPSAVFTVMSFLNCHKYPPSLLFLLMTLGPALCALRWMETIAPRRAARWFIVIGTVPLFYYLAHLLLLRWTSLPMAFARFGTAAFQPPPGHAGSPDFDLWVTYVAWLVAIALLYPACRWFAGVKRRRREWWMSYL